MSTGGAGRGGAAYGEWVRQDGPSVVSFLRRFGSLRLWGPCYTTANDSDANHDNSGEVVDVQAGAGVGAFFDSAPKMLPRLYSICSCPESCPGEVHVLVAQHLYRTGPLPPRRAGWP